MLSTSDTLRPGQKAKILNLRHDPALAQRLMEMGLLEGEVLELIRVAPLGDPMEFKISGYHLSIRKAEAKLIEVEI